MLNVYICTVISHLNTLFKRQLQSSLTYMCSVTINSASRSPIKTIKLGKELDNTFKDLLLSNNLKSSMFCLYPKERDTAFVRQHINVRTCKLHFRDICQMRQRSNKSNNSKHEYMYTTWSRDKRVPRASNSCM